MKNRFYNKTKEIVNTIKRKPLESLILLGVGASSISCSSPKVESVGDITNDGIQDVVVTRAFGSPNGTWVFIGKEDGNFLRTHKKQLGDNNHYLKGDNGEIYFFDKGLKAYKESAE